MKGQRVKGGGGVKESRGNYFFCKFVKCMRPNCQMYLEFTRRASVEMNLLATVQIEMMGPEAQTGRIF